MLPGVTPPAPTRRSSYRAGCSWWRGGHRRAGGLPARACMSEAALPRAHGEAVLSATIRTSPEDFFVEEIDAFAASGAGEHLLLAIEKRGMNTAFAAKL